MSLLSLINKSRKIILEMIELRGFETSKFENYTINEIDVMLKNASKNTVIDSLDILTPHKSNGTQVLIKYVLFSKIRNSNFKNMIDEIIEELNKGDTLIFVYKDKLNDNVIEFLKDNNDGNFLFEFCKNIYPERFFDILYQNSDIFTNDDIDCHFLPEINEEVLELVR